MDTGEDALDGGGAAVLARIDLLAAREGDDTDDEGRTLDTTVDARPVVTPCATNLDVIPRRKLRTQKKKINVEFRSVGAGNRRTACVRERESVRALMRTDAAIVWSICACFATGIWRRRTPAPRAERGLTGPLRRALTAWSTASAQNERVPLPTFERSDAVRGVVMKEFNQIMSVGRIVSVGLSVSSWTPGGPSAAAPRLGTYWVPPASTSSFVRSFVRSFTVSGRDQETVKTEETKSRI